jgi:hypothetical protein
MTVEQANAVYDVLAEHAGASDAFVGESADAPVPPRAEFVFHQTREHVTEYRFMGSLGFGGKFWRNADAWYVTAYSEDVKGRPERAQAVNDTNAALAALDKQEVA